MCIIIAKDKNGRLPSKKELKNSFEYNSDGAGLMYVDNGKVHIDKGYMDFDKFYRHYKKLLKKFNNFKNKSLVLHFRIGTSSGNIPANTHPYPISVNEKDLHKLHITTDLGMAHNGIISEYTPTNKNGSTTNDTQEFIMKYVAPIYKHYRLFYKNEYIMKGMDNITNSKLVFLDSEDNLYYVGDFIEDKNLKFSNSSYEDYYGYKYYSGYSSYSSYDYDNYYAKAWGDELEKEEEIDTSDFIVLDSTWFIEYEDTFEDVGDRSLIYDLTTMDLYRIDGDETELWKENVRVYDENYEDILLSY